MRSTLAAVGLALAGRAGARLASVFGASVSRSTVLRLVEALPDLEVPAPRVVGVDEYATRKGRHYGTVLVDVESRRPVDKLPDREASSLAAWLAKRPKVEVVCRDRAPFYAEGATAGGTTGGAGGGQVAPLTQPERGCGTMRRRPPRNFRRSCAPDPAQRAPEPRKLEDPSGWPWPRGHRFADRTRVNHATVHELPATGLSRRAIGRQLRMTARTVKLLADAATPEDLFQGQRQGRPSKLDAFKPYLDDRWNQGCTNAWRGVGGDRAAWLSGQLPAGSCLFSRVAALDRPRYGSATVAPSRRRMDSPSAGAPYRDRAHSAHGHSGPLP
ncbi:transposase [Streptomyces anulatus]|uniref:transposase n=1 Tax=Streptomyces anulatus TaxID=1892 RepID=UPI00224F0574|nr:transposase [Streptomyces anulatus]MCX4523268.1 transposase [Streptomyces anulatus]MCX4606279.1 transposase [Streptomyces anulatus]